MRIEKIQLRRMTMIENGDVAAVPVAVPSSRVTLRASMAITDQHCWHRRAIFILICAALA